MKSLTLPEPEVRPTQEYDGNKEKPNNHTLKRLTVEVKDERLSILLEPVSEGVEGPGQRCSLHAIGYHELHSEEKGIQKLDDENSTGGTASFFSRLSAERKIMTTRRSAGSDGGRGNAICTPGSSPLAMQMSNISWSRMPLSSIDEYFRRRGLPLCLNSSQFASGMSFSFAYAFRMSSRV
eukprot:m.875710 g.875710  ORF g.875710 m.875710 type:complete len:180 (-) comp59810_c0_seq45:958-1497(-)